MSAQRKRDARVVAFPPTARRKQAAHLAHLRAVLFDLEAEIGRGDDDFVQHLLGVAWQTIVALAGSLDIGEGELRRTMRNRPWIEGHGV